MPEVNFIYMYILNLTVFSLPVSPIFLYILNPLENASLTFQMIFVNICTNRKWNALLRIDQKAILPEMS